jgi:hypothetical protein
MSKQTAINFSAVEDRAQRTLAELRETRFVRTHKLVIATREDERSCGICHQAITANEQSTTIGGELRHLNCALCHVCGKWFWEKPGSVWDAPFLDANGVPMHVRCAVCEGCGEVVNAEDTWTGESKEGYRPHRGHDACGYCWVCQESIIPPDVPLEYRHLYADEGEILLLEDGVRRVHDYCLNCVDCGKPNGERGTRLEPEGGYETVCFDCMTKAHGGDPGWWDGE